jgi:hypothetical protein
MLSDIIYKIIPETYDYYPADAKSIDGAIQILKMYIKADDITWTGFENPAFIDCGSYLESVCCPFCDESIDMDDWQEMMSLSYEKSQFTNIDILLPCCKKMSTLNNIRYQSDCGFAKFVIEVLNPEYPPCKHDLYEASKCFGKLSLRMIIATI